MKRLAFAFVVGAFAAGAHALDFNLTYTAGTSQQAKDGFVAAAALWSSRLTDNVTVNLTVGTQSLGPGILGQAGSASINYSYDTFRTALMHDATSTNDATALASLDAGSSYGFTINGTTNGAGYHTSTANLVAVNTANARALGLLGADNNADAQIEFSNSFAFDFDRSNGITAGQYDFVGIAAHEIGHALGFVSGVDDLDFETRSNNANGRNDAFFADDHSALDLFRWEGTGASAVRSFTKNNAADRYFSFDRGVTKGALFATGQFQGDGRQASHWKDNGGYGIMDPTAGTGEFLSVSENDLQAMDVIGWNRPQAVPEPASMAVLGLGLAAVVRKRKQAKK